MARILLTGPLPKGIGAGMAVIAARDVLKKWTEVRVDQAVRSIDIVVDDWKRENDVTGLHSALIDTIDVLCVIEFDQRAPPAIKGVDMDECIALAILKEAEERPHIATKGGAVLAAYGTSMLERLGAVYDSEWLPHIRRSVAVLGGAIKGHETVHGNREEKIERWRYEYETYAHYLKITKQKTLAKTKAAEQCGVSVRTIERSLNKQREGDI